jgi:hypothetical protein
MALSQPYYYCENVSISNIVPYEDNYWDVENNVCFPTCIHRMKNLVGWVPPRRRMETVECCFVTPRDNTVQNTVSSSHLVRQVKMFYQRALKAQEQGWDASFIQSHATVIRGRETPSDEYYNNAKLPAAAATSIYAHRLVLQNCPTRKDWGGMIDLARLERNKRNSHLVELSQVAANCPQLPYLWPLVDYHWHNHTNIGTTTEWNETWVDMCIWPLTQPSGNNARSLIGAYQGTQPTIDVLQTTAEDANTFRHRRYEFPKQIQRGSAVGLVVTSCLCPLGGVWLIEYLCAYRRFGWAMVGQFLREAPSFAKTIVLAATDAAQGFWKKMGFQDMADDLPWCTNSNSTHQWRKNVRHTPLFIHCTQVSVRHSPSMGRAQLETQHTQQTQHTQPQRRHKMINPTKKRKKRDV